jgi:ariadne-2
VNFCTYFRLFQFEYQQALLEKEVEELSWKVERAETTDRGDLETQMHVAEQKRRILLTDFF